MQCGGEQIQKVLQTHNDWEGTVTEGAEEGESHMRRLWTRDGGGVPRFAPHVPAWEGKGTEMDMNGRSNGGEEPKTFKMEFPRGGAETCPVEGCPGRAGTRTAMRVHFWRRHVRDTVIIIDEGNLPHPRCEKCDMLVPWRSLNGRHKDTAMLRSGADKKRRRYTEA